MEDHVFKTPPIPKNEKERLQALYDLEILDTAPESSFDDFTALASCICNVPISLISLVDENRQWFKSHHGLDSTETPRDISLCGHVIYESKLMVVPNTLEDLRFKNNPLVQGQPCLRFYAGTPLITSGGFNVGTLCVADTKAGTITEQQILALEQIARQVVFKLENHRQKVLLANALSLSKERELSFKAIFEESPLAIVQLSLDSKIIAHNPKFEDLLGYSEYELKGMSMLDFTHHDDLEMTHKTLFAFSRSNRSVKNFEKRYVRKDGTTILCEINSRLVEYEDPERCFLFSVIKDITQQRQEHEKLMQSQKQLKESQQNLNLILENVPSMIVTKDCKNGFRFSYVNKTGLSLLGIKAEDMIGKSDEDFVDKQRALEARNLDLQLIKSREASQVELIEIQTKFGKKILSLKRSDKNQCIWESSLHLVKCPPAWPTKSIILLPLFTLRSQFSRIKKIMRPRSRIA